MKKHILIGNGINIAFSQSDEYKNYSIIERLTKYLGTGRYDDVFGGIISSEELMLFLQKLNIFFNNMLMGIGALRLTLSVDEMQTLIDISHRYHSHSNDLLSVGIEDYFFAMKMAHNKYGDKSISINGLYTGLKYLFLDAIYNDGLIEQLYLRMNAYAGELNKYASIFTVNYDTNLDKLTEKPVYHLHGSFNVLDDTYRPETITGYCAQYKENPPAVIKGKEHLYCNAIMGFSGQQKLNTMQRYAKINEILDKINNLSNIEAHDIIQQLIASSELNADLTHQLILAMIQNPNMKSTEYPIKLFSSIEGELHILGLSPNNDSHLFKIINDNPAISHVVYFSANNEDANRIQKVVKKCVQIRNVYNYWKSLGL